MKNLIKCMKNLIKKLTILLLININKSNTTRNYDKHFTTNFSNIGFGHLKNFDFDFKKIKINNNRLIPSIWKNILQYLTFSDIKKIKFI